MLTEKQIAVVADPAVDGPRTEYESTPLDIDAPIDFDKFREAVESLGPLRIRSASSPYSVEVDVKDCECGCGTPVVRVLRRNGLFSIRWLIKKEDLLEFSSLSNFKDNVLAGALRDTDGERQIIEGEIEREFGEHYTAVEPHVCICGNCAAHFGKDTLWRRMLLSQLALSLLDREDEIEDARKTFGDLVSQLVESTSLGNMPTRVERKAARDWVVSAAEKAVRGAFDLGYQTGRLYSEFQVKDDIEEDAVAGRQFQDIKARRAHSGGQKSSSKRLERMTALISFMEKLTRDNPALLRVGPLELGRLACEDAAKADPGLWSQGAGQLEEYLGEIRRGEAGLELQSRLSAIFAATRQAAN